MTRPIHLGRLAAVALLSLCGVAAAADKPGGPSLKHGLSTASYFTLVAKDLSLFDRANLDNSGAADFGTDHAAIEPAYNPQYVEKGAK